METFDLKIPRPKNCAGIYALSNSSTGEIYIGSTENLYRRLVSWRTILEHGIAAPRVQKAFDTTFGRGWVFVVIEEMPGASTSKLRELEDRLVETYRSNSLVLNEKPVAVGRPAKTEIVTNEGRKLTYREAAAMLGCIESTLRNRMAVYREKGQTVVSIETLIAKSRQYRKELR